MRSYLPAMMLFCGLPICASAQCSIDARITYGVQRVNGNTMQGISIAWAASGDWWNWSASVSGRTWFIPPGGSATAVQSGSGSGPLKSGNDTNPNQPHWANAYATLDSRGNGFYYAEGWGTFTNTCGGVFPIPSETGTTGVTVTRPTITPPFGGYGQNQWAFWYLDGQPNINGYVVSAQLAGSTNFTGAISTMSWTAVDKPAKVSLNPSSGNSTTTVTSVEPSDSTTFDVSVIFSIDGFKSEKLWLHINTPVSLYKVSTFDDIHPDGDGYQTAVEYTPLDLWNYGLFRITTNEMHGLMQAGDNPPTFGWNEPSADVWLPALWTSDYAFKDMIWARDPTGTWRPQPVPPAGLTSLVRYGDQSIHVGSKINGYGTLVKLANQCWFTDHGHVVPGGAACTQQE